MPLTGRRSRRAFLHLAGGISLTGLLLLSGRARAASAPFPLSPDDLYRRLLATPFGPSELPSGFKVNAPSNSASGLQRIEPDLPGLVGAAVLELNGPDLTNTIWYYVFASEAEALDHFENGSLGRSTTSAVAPGTDLEQSSGSGTPVAGAPSNRLTEAYEPSDFSLPSWCVAARAVNWAWTTCDVLTGYVEVVGYSAARPGTGAQRGDDVHAISLAEAALDHLDRLA
jgi:hypothetical protein